MVRSAVTGAVAALAALMALFAAPAFAQGGDYCAETFDRTLGLGRTEDDPVGDCEAIEELRITHSGGVTQVRIRYDSGARSRERALALLPPIRTAIEVVEARMGTLGAVTLPPTVNIIVVSHRHPRDAEVNARTSSQFFRRDSASDDCPVVLYPSWETSAAAKRRTVAHELFHCIQFDTWPEQTRDERETEWWREGSAEWFEDWAFPGDWEDSSLPQSVGLFEEHCETWALHEQRYANVVLFGWLHQQGLPRLLSFIGNLARAGESVEDGLRRAMSAAEYNRFAQDYVEDRIVLPSGWRITGSRRPLTPAGATTGEPEADPDIERPVRKAFIIVREKVQFAPGEYAPDGGMIDEKSVFSEGPGRWSALPERLVVACGETKEFRIVGMPVEASPTAIKVKPRTDKAVQCGECGATGGAVRRAGCVVGSWRQVRGPDCSWISRLGASIEGVTVTPLACEPGEAEATFNRDGSFEGALRNARRRVQMQMTSRRGRSTEMTIETEISLAKGAGLWRADDEAGNLRLCSTTTTGAGVMRMTGVEEASGAPIAIERPMTFGPVAQVDLTYTCASDRMTITVPAAGDAAAPITVELARSSPRR